MFTQFLFFLLRWGVLQTVVCRTHKSIFCSSLFLHLFIHMMIHLLRMFGAYLWSTGLIPIILWQMKSFRLQPYHFVYNKPTYWIVIVALGLDIHDLIFRMMLNIMFDIATEKPCQNAFGHPEEMLSNWLV